MSADLRWEFTDRPDADDLDGFPDGVAKFVRVKHLDGAAGP